MKRYRYVGLFIAIAFMFLAGAGIFVHRSSATGMDSYCYKPPFITRTPPPLVMLVMSKDQKLYFKAYSDTNDLDHDSIPDTTYKDSIEYYGYFDSNKCYNYSNKRFNPSSEATGPNKHYCSGNWSGNFLNWATMAKIDVLRKVIYGGKRQTDENNLTVLSRTTLPQDSHSWAKVYAGSDLGELTPAPSNKNAITICNTNTSNSGQQLDSSLMKVKYGAYPDAATTEGYQCQKTSNDGESWPNGSEGSDFYYVNVKVCDPNVGLESNCYAYGSTNNISYKPTGLLQQMGINPKNNEPTMYFGLITGSYGKSKSGGILRSNISDVNSEIDNTNGTIKGSSSKIIQTLDNLKIVGYNWSDHKSDGCGPGTSAPESTCRDFGNPMGEMYYEALRYFMGQDGPTNQFVASPPDPGINTLPNESNHWCNPYNASGSCTHLPWCSKPYILMLSDTYPSFDSDQLPGSEWYSTISPNDTGLNVKQSIIDSKINLLEGISNVFIGQTDHSSTGRGICTLKSSTDFGNIRGLCPEEPSSEGSFYMAGLSDWAHTTGFNNNGKHKITTYAVVSPSRAPNLDFNFEGNHVQIMPTFLVLSGPYSSYENTENPDRGFLVGFRILKTPTISCPSYDSDCIDETTSHGYQYAYQIIYDDAAPGYFDFDMDTGWKVYIKQSGSTLTIKTKGTYSSAGYHDAGGYIINGVENPGQYLEIDGGNSGGPGFSDTAPYCNGDCTDVETGTYTYNGHNMGWVKRTFNITGAASGSLKDPFWYAAKYGGFNDKNGNDEPDNKTEWDSNGDGLPDTYFYANNPLELEEKLRKALTDILRKASSGTAASVLGTSQKSGANILQAVFYPQKYFNNNTKVEWIGKLQNLWFYLGPFTQNMREDTDGHDNDEIKYFNLKEDNVIEFYSDNSTTMAKVCTDTNGDGRIDGNENSTCKSGISLEDIKPIWEAGKVLWKTPQSKRYIFTDVSELSDNLTKGNFIPKNANALKSYLDADNNSEAKNIIRYIRGKHISGKRDRRVTIGSHTNVWKLGDIIDSTPQMISPTPLNTYWEDYNDNTYKEFTSSDAYKNRGMVFAGANDGMLHAFRLGNLSFPGGNIMAKLTKPDNNKKFGSEAWAFIPKNILPYLKYYMDSNYCHLYYVDLTPYVFDASINKPGEHKTDYYKQTKTGDDNTWRTILIGGLNFGGACGDDNSTAIHPPNETGNVPQGVGRSSYFALDVTDPENPTVLWEFTDNNTAFTTTGPAIIHIPVKYTSGQNSGKDDNSKNGYWYVVFASGPDNYNGTVHQPLYLYVLDLKTGNVMRKWQLSGNNCTLSGDNTCQISLIGNHNAFAGRLFSSQMDLGENYSDDLLYFGYTYGSNSDWHGGVLRLVTGDNGDVNTWKVSKLIGDIGPVTSSVTHIEDTGNHNLWVYFGGGRYFSTDDDGNAQRTIYGVKDTCYNSGSIDNCTNSDTLSLSELDNATDDNNNIDPSTITHGWYINLDPSSGGYGSERVVTNPVATTNGWVFYTTFAPTSDICGFGGKTSVWMVNYDNGGTPQNVEGTVFLQTSNSVINRIELSKEFGAGKGAHNGRKSKSFNGEGSTGGSGGGTFTVPPPPLNSVIHWTETPIRKGK